MARVPVLVDAVELQAYSYLQKPAYILRRNHENEIAAIDRLRKESRKSKLDLYAAEDWKAYEETLYRANFEALERVLRLS